MSHTTKKDLENAVRQLANRDDRIREKAIALIRSDPDESLQYLIESLQTNPGIRWTALCAFRFINTSLLPALPVVQLHLHDENRLCRIAAIEIIIQMGVEAKAATPDLIKFLTTKDKDFRELVLKGLASIGLTPNDSAAIDPLSKLLRQYLGKKDRPSIEVVRVVTALLQAIGPNSLPALVSCLRKAIGGSCKATDSSFLEDDEYDHWLFEPVFSALHALLPTSNGMGNQLLKVLETRAPVEFRKEILYALGYSSLADVDQVVRGLVKFKMAPEYGELYLDLFGAIERIGPVSIPILVQILERHNETESVFAAQILGSCNAPPYPIHVSNELQQAAKAAIPALISAFQAGGEELMQSSAFALDTMTSDAKDAVPVLSSAIDVHSGNGTARIIPAVVQETIRRALKLILR